jgi:hypothetical protein
MLWGGAEPRDAVNVLQHQVSRLREAVGREHVSWQGSGYALEVPADAVDVRQFERRAAGEGRRFDEGIASRIAVAGSEEAPRRTRTGCRRSLRRASASTCRPIRSASIAELDQARG